MNLDTLRTHLTALRLPKVNEVLAHSKPATHLHVTEGTDPASPMSRIGGVPLFSPGVPWPHNGDTPLSLIAQIRLDPLPGVTTALGLPSTGALSFFYDMVNQPWGFDPADRGSFSVVYTVHPDACLASHYPDDLEEDYRVPAVALTPEPTITLPSFLDGAFPSGLLSEDEAVVWADALDDLAEELGWGERTLLGGYPFLIQDDMRLECEMVARGGANAGGPEGYDDPRLPEWKRGAGEWVHLLQVASEEDAGLMWGDLGCLYYWMRKDDLKARRFDQAWMILQCS